MDPQNPPGSGSSGVTLGAAWKYDTGVADADPGNKNFRFNNADPTLATFIYVNDTTNDGVDASNILSLLESGELYIQQQSDSTRVNLYQINGSTTDGGGYWKVPVIHQSAGDTPGYQNNQPCAWIVYTSGGTGGLNAVVDDLSPQLGGSLDTNAFAINESDESIVAAATLLVTNAANYYNVSGNTDVSALADIAVGAVRMCRFTGYLSLIHGVSLFTMTGEDVPIDSNDIVVFKQVSTGPALWRVNEVIRSTGAPLRDTLMLNITLSNWLINTPQVVGDIRIATSDNGVYFECTSAGTTSGVGEPAWNTGSNGVTVDGTVQWITKRFVWGKLYNVTLTDRATEIEVEELGSGGTPVTPAQGTELFIHVTDASTKVLEAKGFNTQTINKEVSNFLYANSSITLKINTTTTNSDIIYEFKPPYESTGQTIVSASLLTLTHGLGVAPKLIYFYVKCTSADSGYSIGDEVVVTVVVNSNASTGRANGVYFDATNIYVRFSSATPVFQGSNKGTGSTTTLANGSWNLYVRAYA